MLNREPMGMKRCLMRQPSHRPNVSVLNREPMGMKRMTISFSFYSPQSFSAQPRADGDEA